MPRHLFLCASLCTTLLANAQAPLPEIRFAEFVETPTSMPGHRSRSPVTDNVMLHVVETLVAFRDDLSIAPMLADSWTISKDGLAYQFKLRRGVTFHNGAPMTAADVVWSYQRMMDPKSEYACRNMYDGTKGAKVASVSAEGSDIVNIRLERPYALFLEQTASVQCPFAILHKSSVDAQGKWLKPVATGPYEFGTWKKGQYLLLTPYAGYKPRAEPPSGLAGAKVAHANVRFVLIPDAAAQKAALMSGQVDLINAHQYGLPPADPRWRIIAEQGIDSTLLLMQTSDPLLSDVRMRRAIALSMDPAGAVKALTHNRTSYNPSLVPLLSRYYSAVHQTGYKQNLAEAKQLLAAVGYKGQVIKLQTNRRYEDMYRVAVASQAMLNKAGIKTELEVLEWATQQSNFRAGRFQLMSFGYTARIDPAIFYTDILGDKAKIPMMQWDNPQARQALLSIAGVSDVEKRKAVFEQLHRQMIADVPMVPLFNVVGLTVVSNRLGGYKTWQLRKPRFFNVTKN